MPTETIVSILGATLLAAGWAIWLLPVGSCAQCAHCRAERVARARASEDQLSRAYGIPLCRKCGRHHPVGEDHRF